METLLAIASTRLDKKYKLFETNSIVIGTKELLQRKIYIKKKFFIFYKMAFWKVYKYNDWRLRKDMEIELWKLSAFIKQ